MIKLKIIAMMICLIGLKTLNADNNFNPTKQGDLYCFSKSEAFELINSYDIMIDLKKDNSYKSNKIVLQSKEIDSLKSNSAIDKKKHVRLFFNGVAVGSGVSLIGTAIIIFKILIQ